MVAMVTLWKPSKKALSKQIRLFILHMDVDNKFSFLS